MASEPQSSWADQESFAALYRDTVAEVRAYLGRRWHDADECDDLCDDVYLIAWRRRSALGAEPLPWLYATARRCLANHRRAVRRRQRLFHRLVSHSPASVQDAPQLDDHTLADAWSQLSVADREILALVAWEALDVEHVAAVLGIRTGTARVRLHRARARLAALLEPVGSDEP